MSEMVKRVATAIRDARLKWGWAEPGKKVMAIDDLLAGAAIAAMREPTEAMKNAYYMECYPNDEPRGEAVWQLMIDAALKA